MTPDPGPEAPSPSSPWRRPPAKTRSSLLRRRLGMALVSLLMGLLLAEVVLRLAGISYPNFYQPDVNRGWALRPGRAGWWHKEGRAFVRISSAGLRDREHEVRKPPGTFRIVVLGDSFAEAMQVELEDTFWAVLERRLAGCAVLEGQAVEVLNFGVSGYGTAQELLTLEHEGWRFEPDLVLLAFYTGNDVLNNLRELDQGRLRPYFVYRESGLALDDSFRKEGGFRLRQSPVGRLLYDAIGWWRTLQLAKEVRTMVMGRLAAYESREAVETIEWDGRDLYVRPDHAVYVEPRSPQWQEAWRVTEGLLVRLQEEVRTRGAELAVVTLTNPIQVHPDLARRQQLMETMELETLLYPERRLRELADRRGMRMLQLAPSLGPQAASEGLFLHGFPPGGLGDGHWNPDGHRVAGSAIADWLCPGLVEAPPRGAAQ